MKNIRLFLLLFSMAFISPRQDTRQEEQAVLQATFEDRANFLIMEFANQYKIPKNFVVLSGSKEWNPYLFRLDSLDMIRLSDSTQRQIILRDEHHPYHHSYLFKDKHLDSLFSIEDKQYLYEQSLQKDTTQLSFQAKRIRLIHSETEVKKGFWLLVTHPLFTKDKKIAIVDMEIHYRVHPTQERNETYFAWKQVVYQKGDSGEWRKVGEAGNLFL